MRVPKATPPILVGLWLLVPLAGAKGDPAEGEGLYKRYCAGCHGADGRGGAHTFMPHIENLTKKGYIEQLSDEYLLTVIKEGGPAVGKSSYMPAWGKTLSDRDIASIIAHIRQLPRY
jgi:mono/diheme cytochrome c family protein